MPKQNPSIAGVLADVVGLREGDGDAIAAAITRLAVLLAADDRELLRVKDVAEILSVSEDTIWRATKDGELPTVHIGRERTGVRIIREDLATYVVKLLQERRAEVYTVERVYPHDDPTEPGEPDPRG